MEEPVIIREDSVGGDAGFLSPPPSKKLKQARLPFKVLSPKTEVNLTSPVASNGANKKRKLSDGATGPIKAPKTPRSEEENKHKINIQNAENEVSSSSEASESKKTKEKGVKRTGLMDQFVKSTKSDEPEVSTSGVNDVVDLIEGKKELEEKENSKEGNKENNEKEDEKENECKLMDIEEADENEEKSEEETASKDGSSLAPPDVENSLKSPEPQGKPKAAKTPVSGRKSIVSKEEKERQRKEREEKKQKEKEEKEKQKQEEKERKEKEREEKKKKLEEEKKEKLKQKEEEKKKKLEEKRLELEEKEKEKQKQKEEKEKERERLKEEKELEKQKQEMDKMKVSKKQKSLFQNFFNKKEKDEYERQQAEEHGTGLFMPFQLKKDTRLAPIRRVDAMEMEERIASFNPAFKTQDTKALYLEELNAKKTKLAGGELKTWPYIPEDSNCCMIMEDEVAETEATNKKKKPKKERMKVKLLLFHENNRPAYYGTWQKTSTVVTPRRPLGKETAILDYEVDSDDEWEEEEPGESLSASEDENEEKEDEEKEENDDEEDEDGFFVPHGYLSEGEGGDEDDDDATPERLKARQLAKAKAFEVAQSKKTEVLKPVAVGCTWDEPGKTLNLMEQVLEQFKMVVLTASLPIPMDDKRGDETAEGKKKHNKKDKRKLMSQNVPQEAYPDLVRLVHGNICGLPKLVKEFREFWRLKEEGKKPQEEGKKLQEEGKKSEEDGKKSEEDGKKPEEGKKSQEDPVTMETDQPEATAADSQKEAGTEKEEVKKYSISKRQLEKTVKEIAVYERREQTEFKRNCWYVNDEVLKKYEMTDLPVPTTWQWITRPAPKERPCPSPVPNASVAGRLTPSLNTPKQQATSSITKFTVAGVTPKIYEPTPVKAKSVEVGATTPAANSQKKRMMDMFSNAPPPKNKPQPDRPISPGLATANIIKMEQDSDSDCAIIGVDLKPDKNQPSVKSMFKPKPKPVGGIEAKSNVDKSKAGLNVPEIVVTSEQKTPQVTGNVAAKKTPKQMKKTPVAKKTVGKTDKPLEKKEKKPVEAAEKKSAEEPKKKSAVKPKKKAVEKPEKKAAEKNETKTAEKNETKAAENNGTQSAEKTEKKPVEKKKAVVTKKAAAGGAKGKMVVKMPIVKKVAKEPIVKKVAKEKANVQEKKAEIIVTGLGTEDAPMEID